MMSWWLRFFTLCLAVVAIVLFDRSRHKDVYDKVDLKLTYLFLGCIVALEMLSFFNARLIYRRPHIWPARKELDQMVLPAERHVVRLPEEEPHLSPPARGTRRLRRLPQPEPLRHKALAMSSIESAVHTHVMNGWTDISGDADRYRRFNDQRGQGAVVVDKMFPGAGVVLRESLVVPFD